MVPGSCHSAPATFSRPVMLSTAHPTLWQLPGDSLVVPCGYCHLSLCENRYLLSTCVRAGSPCLINTFLHRVRSPSRSSIPARPVHVSMFRSILPFKLWSSERFLYRTLPSPDPGNCLPWASPLYVIRAWVRDCVGCYSVPRTGHLTVTWETMADVTGKEVAVTLRCDNGD